MTQPQPDGPQGVTTERGHGMGTQQWQVWGGGDDSEPTPELQWPFNLPVYEVMAKADSQVRSTMRAVTLPVLQTKWRIDPAGASAEVTQFVAQNLGLPIVGKPEDSSRLPRERDRFSFRAHLQLAMLSTRYGHMPFEQVYRYDPESGKFQLRKLAPRWPRTLERFNVAPDGGLISIEQARLPKQRVPGETGNIVLPVNRLVVYVHEQEGGVWTGNSLLRSAYPHWLLKRQAMRTWAVRDDRNGAGVPVYEAAPAETSLTKGLALARSHRAGETAGAAIQNGASFRLIGVEGQLPDVEKQVRYHDEAISRAVLAHFLNLGQQTGTGSYALGSSFMDFFVMSLEALAQQFADTATQHVVEDLVDLNYGETEPAPKIVFDPIGQAPGAIVAAVKALIEAGAIFPDPVLDAFVRQATGLPPKAPLPNPRTPAGATGVPAPGTDDDDDDDADPPDDADDE